MGRQGGAEARGSAAPWASTRDGGGHQNLGEVLETVYAENPRGICQGF